MKKKVKEEKWLILTDYPHEYIEWYRDKNEAIEKAKKLTKKDNKKHIIALATFAFKPADAIECKIFE